MRSSTVTQGTRPRFSLSSRVITIPVVIILLFFLFVAFEMGRSVNDKQVLLPGKLNSLFKTVHHLKKNTDDPSVDDLTEATPKPAGKRRIRELGNILKDLPQIVNHEGKVVQKEEEKRTEPTKEQEEVYMNEEEEKGDDEEREDEGYKDEEETKDEQEEDQGYKEEEETKYDEVYEEEEETKDEEEEEITQDKKTRTRNEKEGRSTSNNTGEDTEEVTFVFAAFNINRTAHLGKSGKNYRFEEDYIEHINWFLDFLSPLPTHVIVEKRYASLIQPHLHSRASMSHLEISDLRAFQWFDRIEEIRTSKWWTSFTPWLKEVPQGYSSYYNPIVMQKVVWLYDIAKLNPHKTRYFAWLDSGGICSPTIQFYGKEFVQQKLIWNLYDEKFFITLSPYRGAGEIHGCDQRKLIKVTGRRSEHVMKGWIMGGTLSALSALVPEYMKVLEDSLKVDCLGTEETLFTMTYMRHPQLFNPFNNSEPYDQWADNVCKFFVEPKEDEEKREKERQKRRQQTKK